MFGDKKRYIILNNAASAMHCEAGCLCACLFHIETKENSDTGIRFLFLGQNDKSPDKFSCHLALRLLWFLSINQTRTSDIRITINFNRFNETFRDIRRINLRFNEKNFPHRVLHYRLTFSVVFPWESSRHPSRKCKHAWQENSVKNSPRLSNAQKVLKYFHRNCCTRTRSRKYRNIEFHSISVH